ncbi:hypothetical protein HYPSUDRAFT_529331 [Hypholoma sublateritium FD-334 SS-4]|uniref:Uncharacterized protein n=1 Tax=Hypholoma sublateritium (strain FD-334 SS-4) TaxID=945553 RepID=A0A0D2PYH1_HYPSF|nr:hypothetical protein HYPSUDRAFT_529331 [Hypholoma sublateritium FD-334 SS-4]
MKARSLRLLPGSGSPQIARCFPPPGMSLTLFYRSPRPPNSIAPRRNSSPRIRMGVCALHSAASCISLPLWTHTLKVPPDAHNECVALLPAYMRIYRPLSLRVCILISVCTLYTRRSAMASFFVCFVAFICVVLFVRDSVPEYSPAGKCIRYAERTVWGTDCCAVGLVRRHGLFVMW